MVVGFAVSVTVRGPAAVTATVTCAVMVPPRPFTVIMKVVVCVGVKVMLPLVGTWPTLLLIWAVVAPVEDQVRVTLCPALMVVELAVIATVGAVVEEDARPAHPLNPPIKMRGTTNAVQRKKARFAATGTTLMQHET